MKKLFTSVLLAAAVAAPMVSHAAPQQGHILINNPIYSASELAGDCNPNAPTQGLDGAWFSTSAGATVDVILTDGATGLEDLDVYFYDANCSYIDSNLATENPSEHGIAPAGAKWLVVDLFTGADASFTVSA